MIRRLLNRVFGPTPESRRQHLHLRFGGTITTGPSLNGVELWMRTARAELTPAEARLLADYLSRAAGEAA